MLRLMENLPKEEKEKLIKLLMSPNIRNKQLALGIASVAYDVGNVELFELLEDTVLHKSKYKEFIFDLASILCCGYFFVEYYNEEGEEWDNAEITDYLFKTSIVMRKYYNKSEAYICLEFFSDYIIDISPLKNNDSNQIFEKLLQSIQI